VAISLLTFILCSIGCQGLPVITQFYADNSTVAAGKESQLHWSVSGANSIVVRDNYGDNITVSNNHCVVNPIQTTIYNLIASNSVGTDNKTLVITIDPITIGDMYLKQGKNDAALSAYESAIALNPNLESAWIGKIQSLLNLNQYADAIKTCDTAEEIFPKSSTIYCLMGIAYNESGQYDKAIIALNKALEIDPKYALAYIQRGNAYSDEDVSQSADNPDYTLANWTFGNKDQWANAIADFTNGIDLDPTNIDAYIGRGCAYAALGKNQFPKAIIDYTKAIEINPQHIRAYFDRGIVYQLDGQFDKSISDFTQAIKFDPSDPFLYYSRGVAYIMSAQWDNAKADFLKVSSISWHYEAQGVSSNNSIFLGYTTNDNVPLLRYAADEESSIIDEGQGGRYTIGVPTVGLGTGMYNLFPSVHHYFSF